MPELKKIHKTAKLITDVATLEKLNKSVVIKKEMEDKPPKECFWAIASAEDTNGDRDGDIVSVKGIQYDVDEEQNKFLPLLPNHMRQLASGNAPQIGRIEQCVKTEIDNMPVLAMKFSFALDDEGKPLDDLTASYYYRYKNGYINEFSVGMESLEAPKQLPTGGYMFGKTQLYEVSCVTVPANALAVGLTRSLEDVKLEEKIDKVLELLNKLDISKSFNDAFIPLVERLDILESKIVFAQKKEKQDNSLINDLAKMIDNKFKKE